MKRDDSVYLQHILDAIIKIEKYLQGIDEVWLAAKNDTPPLKNAVMRILEKL